MHFGQSDAPDTYSELAILTRKSVHIIAQEMELCRFATQGLDVLRSTSEVVMLVTGGLCSILILRCA